MEEMKRVLKPKSKALIKVWDKRVGKFNEEDEEALKAWELKDGSKTWRYYKLYTRKEIIKLLSEYFRIVNTNFRGKKNSEFEKRNLTIEVENK